MKQKIISTIRKCNKCGYETLRIYDKKSLDVRCKYCDGKLEIIAREK